MPEIFNNDPLPAHPCGNHRGSGIPDHQKPE